MAKTSQAKIEIAKAADDAVKLIASAAADNVKILANAASDATRLIANATMEAAKVVANTAAATAKVVDTKTSGDHDLLTKLDTKVDQIQADVTVLKNQDKQNITQVQHQDLCSKTDDHEGRLRLLEQATTRILTWGTAGVLALGVLEFIINKYL